MKEIEVKARVKNPAEVIAKLKELGCELADPVTQHDRIFLPQGIKFSQITRGMNVLRIRDQEGRLAFNLKQHRANELDCIEHEVAVSDVQEMIAILGYLGYSEVIQVKKTRRRGDIRGYEVCIDEVGGLGSFIELEKLCEEDGLTVQEELFRFLMDLGISKEDRVTKGYDTLLYEKSVKAQPRE